MPQYVLIVIKGRLLQGDKSRVSDTEAIAVTFLAITEAQHMAQCHSNNQGARVVLASAKRDHPEGIPLPLSYHEVQNPGQHRSLFVA